MIYAYIRNASNTHKADERYLSVCVFLVVVVRYGYGYGLCFGLVSFSCGFCRRLQLFSLFLISFCVSRNSLKSPRNTWLHVPHMLRSTNTHTHAHSHSHYTESWSNSATHTHTERLTLIAILEDTAIYCSKKKMRL